MTEQGTPRRSASGLISVAALIWTVVSLTPSVAQASSFQLVEQSGSGLGNAFAGQAASVKDASAIFFNPAALTRVEGGQFVIGVNTIGPSVTFADLGSTRPYLPTNPPMDLSVPMGSEGGDAGAWAPIPNAYFSWQANDRLWFGLGVNILFGLKSEWEDGWMGRFHGVKSEVKTLNFNPTIAVQLNEALSIGAGISYQKLQATLTQGLPYGGLAAGAAATAGGPAALAGILGQLGGPQGLAAEGMAEVEGDSWGWGFNAGVQLTLAENVRVAASYRSTIDHELSGDVTFEGAPAFATDGPLGPLGGALNAAFSNGEIVMDMTLPDTFSAAASFEGDKLELMADWTWTGWSIIQDLAVVRVDGSEVSSVRLRFEDSWRIGLGASYALNDRWILRLGTAYDKAPVQDELRTPRLPDEDRTWAAAGVQWRLSSRGSLDLGYAHLFVKQASSDLANQDDPAASPKGDLIGSYTGSIDILSLQYSLSF